MDITIIILIFKSAAISIAASMFIYKYQNAQRYKARYKSIGSKWILWYDSIEILGTSSPSRRDFMQTHNKLSTIMWVSVLLLILLFLIPF
ncbi:hypothetical protein BH10BAC3_BH10BAC3_40460 [soil metagenome]